MKLSPLFGLAMAITTLSSTPALVAQAQAGKSLSETALYSLYAKRHVATAAFADLATGHASDDDVRKLAEQLGRANKEARENLDKAAADRHLTLALPEHDTTTVLLAQARTALEGKTGRAFDSTWVNLGNAWLMALVLDNNREVKPLIGPELQPLAKAHTTYLFHQLSDMSKVKEKFNR